MDAKEYMQQRVEDQIDWYSRKATLNKKWFIRLEVLSILLSVSIPFVSNFMDETTPWIKHVVSLMGVLIAGISGLVGLMKYRDNWVEYRTTAELLRHERFMFLTKSGAYAGRKRFDLFVQAIENLLSKEISNWKNYTTTAPENQDEAPAIVNEAPVQDPEPPVETPVEETPAPEAPMPEEAPATEAPAAENTEEPTEEPTEEENPPS